MELELQPQEMDECVANRDGEGNLMGVKFLTVKNFIFDAHTKP